MCLRQLLFPDQLIITASQNAQKRFIVPNQFAGEDSGSGWIVRLVKIGSAGFDLVL